MDDINNTRIVLATDASDPTDLAEALVPYLSNLPADHAFLTIKYDSFDILIYNLLEYRARACFSVIKLRNNNYIKDFSPLRIDLACSRGRIRASEAYSRDMST